ncbi:fatty acyl-CoA reductase 2-like [Sesamum indicum]|uniref:Fatty acyl-CoA reductase n=1 Tax=Sesamum indicum TaxID=4182 RepID=A0A8M8UYR1_SESIN|nr:fatty acyl-CoA reductase 2-like [Sesamum indicum]
MLLTVSPFLITPPSINLSLGRRQSHIITNPSFLAYNDKNIWLKTLNCSSRHSCCSHLNANYFIHGNNPNNIDVVNATTINVAESPKTESPKTTDDSAGIGILNFFQGKNIFITGATEFLGKALVEKLLRSTAVGKIYVLIKAEDKAAAFDRLKSEIINSELLKCLREEHGASYEAFIQEKLIPVAGNICEPELGMDVDTADNIMNEVDVIIQSAANTSMIERYDSLFEANVSGPQRLMRFAKRCKNLILFVHISTAFVNGEREGVNPEKPMTMGENRRKNISSSFPQLDIANEMSLAFKSITSASTELEATIYSKKLGQQRARFYGWFDAYQLTKAMGEMIINECKGDTPVVIVRPAVIESSYKEPFPGWIQGYRVTDPLIISYGKGHLPAFLGDPEVKVDIIPVDMVVNTIIAATAKHGIGGMPGLDVYHSASAIVNPLRYYDVFEFSYEYFNSNPLIESSSKGSNIKEIKFFDNIEDLSKYTQDEICQRDALQQTKWKAKILHAIQLCKIYEFSGFYEGRFDISNTQKLLSEMSEEEQRCFGLDARIIDWRKYFCEIHIPGLKKHVLNL